jgi:transposase
MIIQLALSPPRELGKPFCHWSLDLLQEELNQKGHSMRRSQIRRVLRAEGVKWQKERTWFASPDPEFAVKRGRLLGSTNILRKEAT